FFLNIFCSILSIVVDDYDIIQDENISPRRVQHLLCESLNVCLLVEGRDDNRHGRTIQADSHFSTQHLTHWNTLWRLALCQTAKRLRWHGRAVFYDLFE